MSTHAFLLQPGDQSLDVLEPLRSLIRACETFCVAGCCGVDAFDVNVYVMLWWVKHAGDNAAAEAADQLGALIAAISAHKGAVVSDGDFETTWSDGSECAAYLETWQIELSRARSLAVSGAPSAEQRLADARQHSHRAFYLDVRRLTTEAGGRFRAGDHAGALTIFGLIAALDENDAAIESEVIYSRGVLRTNDLLWNVDPKTRATFPADYERRSRLS